ncbi:MAG: TatD family hydrolase [Dehalococcoidia bacterium]|nr:TatD family hydrolase [Dehalococcoidia bacterium]
MKLLDLHTHIDKYPETEIKQILDRANRVGVAGAILAGTTVESSNKCVALADADDRLFASVGIHPMEIPLTNLESHIQAIEKLALMSNVVAISEIGLDRMVGAPDFKKQEDIFRAHIQIAKTTNLPIIYHSRESYPYILDVLEEEEAYKVGGAAHYFQGDVSTAYRCIELGFFISIAKPVLRIPELQEVVNKIPLENILIETDSFPQPFKKNRKAWTEPRHLVDIVEKIATIKGKTATEVSIQMHSNLMNLFKDQSGAIDNILSSDSVYSLEFD